MSNFAANKKVDVEDDDVEEEERRQQHEDDEDDAEEDIEGVQNGAVALQFDQDLNEPSNFFEKLRQVSRFDSPCT